MNLNLSIPVPEEMRQKIEEAAKAEDRSMASWIRRAIIDQLERDESSAAA